MDEPVFVKLNDGWNAEPNDPDEDVLVQGDTATLSFFLNPWAYAADESQRGRLVFTGCKRWRLGPTNDEGWYRGICRYSGVAPGWCEFYEIEGPDSKMDQPPDWQDVQSDHPGKRHFLFYMRDRTFECIAADWSFEPQA